MAEEKYRADEGPVAHDDLVEIDGQETFDELDPVMDESSEFIDGEFAEPTHPSGQVRIAAVEAAVAAGLVPSTSRAELSKDDPDETLLTEQPTVVELPAWTAPPTGQVPRVLLDEGVLVDETAFTTRGPSWRQDSADWDEAVDLSIFASDGPSDGTADIAGQGEDIDDSHPYEFGDLGLGDEIGDVLDDDTADDQAWAAMLGDPSAASGDDEYGLGSFGSSQLGEVGRNPRRRRGGAHRAGSGSRSPQVDAESADASVRSRRAVSVDQHVAGPKKSAVIATTTGLVVAAIAVVCFFVGALASLVLATVVITVGAGEMFAVLRRVGFQPATAVGLVITPALMVGTYLRGPSAVPFLLAIGFVATGLLCLFGRVVRPAINIGATFGVICWVGVLGSFAGLLLAPSVHPHGHGVALVVAAIALTVAHDVGSYAVGSRLGRRALAPSVSPNKTLEGLIGGTIAVLVVAVAIISHLHPLSLGFTIQLGVVVAVFAPIGDLIESLLKRDLGVKDMGNLLPGHGGILDRIDAMLFVLPATYYLASLHHLG